MGGELAGDHARGPTQVSPGDIAVAERLCGHAYPCTALLGAPVATLTVDLGLAIRRQRVSGRVYVVLDYSLHGLRCVLDGFLCFLDGVGVIDVIANFSVGLGKRLVAQ